MLAYDFKDYAKSFLPHTLSNESHVNHSEYNRLDWISLGHGGWIGQ